MSFGDVQTAKSKVRSTMMPDMENVCHVQGHVKSPIQCVLRIVVVGVAVLMVMLSITRALSVSTPAPAPECVSC